MLCYLRLGSSGARRLLVQQWVLLLLLGLELILLGLQGAAAAGGVEAGEAGGHTSQEGVARLQCCS